MLSRTSASPSSRASDHIPSMPAVSTVSVRDRETAGIDQFIEMMVRIAE